MDVEDWSSVQELRKKAEQTARALVLYALASTKWYLGKRTESKIRAIASKSGVSDYVRLGLS